MRVPVRLPVGGKIVTLKYVSELTNAEGEAIFGEYTCTDRTIKISTSRPMNEEQVWETVFHETTHAALDISGVNNVLKSNVEEAVAHALDSLLAPLMALRAALPGMRYSEVEFDFEAD